jgi:hypothetical protein
MVRNGNWAMITNALIWVRIVDDSVNACTLNET